MRITQEDVAEKSEAAGEAVKSIVDPQSNDMDRPVPETKKDKFFRIMDTFGDLVFLNICFIVGCLPIITIGASFTALYSVTLKMVRKEESTPVKMFWKAYKDNLKPATKAWVVVLMFFFGIYLEYYYMIGASETAKKVMIVVIGLEMLLLSFILPLLFPLIARYENTTAQYFRNSVVISLTNIWTWFRVFIAWMGPLLFTLSNEKVLIYGWYAWLFILFGLLAYVNSMLLRDLFGMLENAQEEKEKAGKEDE